MNAWRWRAQSVTLLNLKEQLGGVQAQPYVNSDQMTTWFDLSLTVKLLEKIHMPWDSYFSYWAGLNLNVLGQNTKF